MKLANVFDLIHGRNTGDYADVVDPASRKTIILGLNVFPPRINRVDAVKALKTVR